MAKVLVVGAGALGNEILKNLALLGFKLVVVVDLDRIEVSNLSRSVLYRSNDVGKTKAETAAEAYVNLYPDADVKFLSANILTDVGLGLFGWADIILAGLDNREARLWINRSAWKMGRPWIDGAIEGLSGVARMFLPGEPPCYECTLGETDWTILGRRMSCNLLTNEEIAQGRVATTPTTSSVIAGIEVQEAVKHLHGLPVLNGKGFVFDGINHSSYLVEYTENPDCMSHYRPHRLVEIDGQSNELTLDILLQRAKRDLSANEVTIEFSRDVIEKLVCPHCGEEEQVFAPVGAVSTANGHCRRDGAMRSAHTISNYRGGESWGMRPLTQLGLPLWDLYIARDSSREIGYAITGDASSVLGSLYNSK